MFFSAGNPVQAHLAGQRILVLLLLGVSSIAWFALWWFGASPYGGIALHHHHMTTEDGGLTSPVLFLAGWLLMTTAMMLPTSIPLLGMFHLVTRSRPSNGLLLALVIAGYLTVWILFGLLTQLLIWGWLQAVSRLDLLRSNTHSLAVATLLLAGGYQFTSWKYRCLDKCRSPFGFVAEHWRGTAEKRQALLLGMHHGFFCVGCCWTLMLLMIPMGAGSLVWMLILGMLMAIEKNVSWGRRFAKPLGASLLALAAVLAFS